MERHTFLSSGVSAAAFESLHSQRTSAAEAKAAPPVPLVWPVVTKQQPGIRLFAGHTDTVPDIVGRIGAPPSLVIFTEGNHLMVVLSDDGAMRQITDVQFCSIRDALFLDRTTKGKQLVGRLSRRATQIIMLSLFTSTATVSAEAA